MAWYLNGRIEMLTPQQNHLRLKLMRFFGRRGLNIGGFTDGVALELVSSLIVNDIADVYRLTVEQWEKVPVVRKKGKAKSIYNSLRRKKTIELERFVTGLGIPGVCEKKSILLARKFKLLGKLMVADKWALRACGCFTEQTLQSVVRYFSDDRNIELIWKLREEIGIKVMEYEDGQIRQ